VQPGPQVEEIVQRVWPGRAATHEPLGGGITNQNFRVAVDGEAFVLRISGKDTELLGIDRFAELGASRMAAVIGIGPEVAAFVEPEGYLVTRFIEGEPIPPERMRTDEGIGRVASALRTLHAGGDIPGRFDAHRVVEDYAAISAKYGVRQPDDYAWAKAISDRIESGRGPQPLVPCHNDLLNANFIDDGEGIRIVDWEYAGMGDRFFDLANLSINHEFGEAENETLLRSYFGEIRDTDLSALRLMRFMSDFREAMWGVVQQGISELDFDFKQYADEHFDRLRATAESRDFRGALAALEG
jgi:thiamine kinase-like enzyme